VGSIVFRSGQDEFMRVLMAGPKQISWPTLRAHLGRSRMTMATPDEVLRVTGYQTGSVSPFGLPQPMHILVDESVLAHEEVSLGSGKRNTTIILKSADLLKALGQVDVGAFG